MCWDMHLFGNLKTLGPKMKAPMLLCSLDGHSPTGVVFDPSDFFRRPFHQQLQLMVMVKEDQADFVSIDC